jgi:hypothetical protein
MNGKYNREAISIGETTWLVCTKVKWCGYQGKVVTGNVEDCGSRLGRLAWEISERIPSG